MTTDGDTLHFEFSRVILTICGVKFTLYFMAMRQRPDRAIIQMEWIRRVIERPEKEAVNRTDASAAGHASARWTDAPSV